MVNHAEPSQAAFEIADKESETTTASSAQPEEAPIFKLHTIGRANRAYLEQDGTGRLSLHFRGLRYGVDDFLPSSIFGLSVSPSVTAGEFVCRQMLQRFGSHEDQWPALVRQFLKKHTTGQPDRRETVGRR